MKAPLALLVACLLLDAAGARAGSCPFTAGTLGQQPVSPNNELAVNGETWKMPDFSSPSNCTAEEYETIARELVTLAEVRPVAAPQPPLQLAAAQAALVPAKPGDPLTIPHPPPPAGPTGRG